MAALTRTVCARQSLGVSSGVVGTGLRKASVCFARHGGDAIALNAPSHLMNRSFGFAGLPGLHHRLGSNYGTRGTLDAGFGSGNGGFGNGNGGFGGFGNDRWWDEGPEDSEPVVSSLDAFLRSVAACYSTASTKYPVLTSGVLTACSMVLAECITQLLVLRNPQLNTEPVLRALVYGVLVKGPLLVHFYGALNNVFKSRKGLNLLLLLAADCGFGNFLFCSVYAFVMPLLKGFSAPEAAAKCTQDTLGLWSVGVKIWTPAMLLNYLFLPASLQVPYILAVDVLVNIGMTLKARQAIQNAVSEHHVEVAPVLGTTSDAAFGDRVEIVDAVSLEVTVDEAMQIVEERLAATFAA